MALSDGLKLLSLGGKLHKHAPILKKYVRENEELSRIMRDWLNGKLPGINGMETALKAAGHVYLTYEHLKALLEFEGVSNAELLTWAEKK